MDSDRPPLGKGKDILHGATRAVPLKQSVEQPWHEERDCTFGLPPTCLIVLALLSEPATSL